MPWAVMTSCPSARAMPIHSAAPISSAMTPATSLIGNGAACSTTALLRLCVCILCSFGAFARILRQIWAFVVNES